jgi:hypothetical protein
MTIVHKRSSVAGKSPVAADLALGELAVNTTDGKIYMKKSVGGVESVLDFTKTVDGATAIGDLFYSNAPLSAPTYLPADGSAYAQSAYPELYAMLGQLNADHVLSAGGNTGSGVQMTSVAYGNGKFWGTTGGSTSVYKLYSSTDGLAWTLVHSSVLGQSIAVNGNTMVVVGQLNGSLQQISNIQYSTNGGTTWTNISNTFGATAGSDYARRVIFANGLFVMVGGSATYPNQNIATSPDGITWTRRTNPTGAALYQLAWTGSNFIIFTSSANTVLTSPDGITWTVRNVVGASSVQRAGGTNGKGVALVVDYSNNLFRSTDHGVTWAKVGVIAGVPDTVFSGNTFQIYYAGDEAGGFILPCGDSTKSYYLRSNDEGLTFEQVNTTIMLPREGAYANRALIFGGPTGSNVRMTRPYDMTTAFSTPAPASASLPGSTSKMYIRAK